MTDPSDFDVDLDDDDQLLGLVREAFRGDAAIDMAFDLRHLDATFAAEIEDTALTMASGVRDGGHTDRVVTFQIGELFLEVSLEAVSDIVHGQLLPPRSAEVELETMSARQPVTVDELGRFSARADGPRFRVRVSGGGLAPVVTGWIFR